MTILAAENLSIEFGGVRAVDNVSLAINKAEIFAIIGPNGAGKTTLFNLISGVYTPKSGRVHLVGEDITHKPVHTLAARGLSRTFQNMQIFFRMTAIENVMVGRHLHERRNLFAHLCMLPSVRRQNEETRHK
jgi:branched-chain amino acid transport system ATP-binding protein